MKMTLSEAEAAYGVPANTLHKWIDKGWIKAEKEPSLRGAFRYVVESDEMERALRERECILRKIRERAARKGAKTRMGVTEEYGREVPERLLPAFHLFVRAVASGVNIKEFGRSNPFGRAASRVRLVEREEDVKRAEARACMAEDMARTVRWTGRRWIA